MSSTMTATDTGRAQPRRRTRQIKRRMSISIPTRSVRQFPPTSAKLQVCQPLPPSLDALDLSTASPTQALASVRFIVLSYLADLEQRLSNFHFGDFELPDLDRINPDHCLDNLRLRGEEKLEDARRWAREALDMLSHIRAEVCSHLPEFSQPFVFSDTAGAAMESFVNDMKTQLQSRLPDLHVSDVPFATRLSDMSQAHLPEFSLDLDSVRSKLSDIGHPFDYLPQLSEHLHNLHTHLSTDIPYSAVPSFSDVFNTLSTISADVLAISCDLPDALTPSMNVSEMMQEGEVIFERAAHEMREVAQAIQHSLEGVKLITYADLPEKWRNNPFVRRGYRFIPIERWPLIVMSLFAFHNETLNIHTHLIPFLLWAKHLFYTLIPSLPTLSLWPLPVTLPLLSDPSTPHAPFISDTPELLFTAFALLCLLASALWHTMSGCAHRASMEFCARVDYVGIGWLISASVGTVVYYGFADCHPGVRNAFLACSFLTGLAGNICPFMTWFNQYKYRVYRIAFFLSLAFSSIAPLAALTMLYSSKDMLNFIGPIVPSLLSYIIGLIFYATHIPERWLPERIATKLDLVGGGSHCIWHCFIVLAVSQHKEAMRVMKEGIACRA